MYEVEMKFPVADSAGIVAAIQAAGATFEGTLPQVDRYFNHPGRDFAATDEALRLRRAGDVIEITYKGPKIDTSTKTRREISLPLAVPAGASSAEALAAGTELLEALGFRAVEAVAKERSLFSIDRDGHHVEIAINRVEGLGTYVELEVMAEEGGVAAARDCLLHFAASLGLVAPERRSYLELVLQAGRLP